MDDRSAYRTRPADPCAVCDAPLGDAPTRSQRFYNARGKQVLLFEVLKGMSWTTRVVSDPCCSAACDAAWWRRFDEGREAGATRGAEDARAAQQERSAPPSRRTGR